jgi:putative PIN family toxin of toxin-antitoxin system
LAASLLRLVLDTNVLLAGLVSESSASQKVVIALQSRTAIPLVSAQVMAEYRAVLLHPAIAARHANLTSRRVALVLHRLRYIADDYETAHVNFELPRDPLDAKFIELAIAGDATHIVTLDNDLLSLPAARDDTGKRFRQRLRGAEILQPGVFVARYAQSLGLE